MSIYKCPKGHESTESDYCSECGAKIEGIPKDAIAASRGEWPFAPTSTVLQAARAVVNCPDCTAPHDPDSGVFCEICGYNFVSGGHGEVPPATPAAGVVPPSFEDGENNSPVISTQSKAIALFVVVTVDPSLREEGSPPPPANLEPITFRLDKESNLIGRSSEKRGIHPEIALDFDDAVSHRHALLIRQPDGTFILRDIGSSNGTKLNGVELAAMVDTPIEDGDEFTLGHWTRIAVKALSKGGF